MRPGERTLGDPQNVAGVAVAVQTQAADLACPREAGTHAGERLVDDAAIGLDEIDGNEAVRQQPLARLLAEARDGERRTRGERRRASDRMNAPEIAAEPLAHLSHVQLGSTSAAQRVDRETVAGETGQGSLVSERHRRDDRYLALEKLAHESMLFENLRIAP